MWYNNILLLIYVVDRGSNCRKTALLVADSSPERLELGQCTHTKTLISPSLTDPEVTVLPFTASLGPTRGNVRVLFLLGHSNARLAALLILLCVPQGGIVDMGVCNILCYGAGVIRCLMTPCCVIQSLE